MACSQLAAFGLVLAACAGVGRAQSREPVGRLDPGGKKVHVIYGTDLFHPHVDPDDHYDLATLLAIPEFQLEAILLDLGDRQRTQPGRIPVEQMFRITGRRAPYAAGLSRKLSSPEDKGLDQPAEDQKAVELLLETLRAAREPVTVITAGSVRDVCAAFNREPELLRQKVDRLYINIGAAENAVEWNVGLDAHAYVRVMRSGLPVYWCPCVPMRADRRSTYWKFRQGDLFEQLQRPMLDYFIYALQQVSPEELDPMRALEADLRPWRRLPGAMERNMWCTASFLHAAGLSVHEKGGHFVPGARANAGGPEVFGFVAVAVEIDDHGRTRSSREDAQGNVRVFTTADPARYQKAMTDCLGWLLRSIPAHSPHR